jgi:hypothetical protein
MTRPNDLTYGICAALVGATCALLASDVAAEAPPGQFVVDGEVVNDTKTKLIWQRTAATDPLQAADAVSYCATLKVRGSGWRLPSIKELHTLVDETRTVPAIDVSVFPDTPPTFFWTASRVASFNQYVRAVNFSEGTDAWFTEDKTVRWFVRCVR